MARHTDEAKIIKQEDDPELYEKLTTDLAELSKQEIELEVIKIVLDLKELKQAQKDAKEKGEKRNLIINGEMFGLLADVLDVRE